MKPVSSLEISFGTEPFFAETKTLILMNLNIGTYWVLYLYLKSAGELEYFGFVYFLYRPDIFF